jgi:hypothetical protein
MKTYLERSDYIRSLDQLLTISAILSGFAFSGLIALPSIDESLLKRTISMLAGDFELVFYTSFYALFFATLCFLSTIMTVFVYRVGNYLIPLPKLQRVHLIANLVFSLAIAALIISVVALGIPNRLGILVGITFGMGVAACFIWENMVPWQRKRREQQLQKERSKQPSTMVESKPVDSGEDGLTL